MLLGVFMGYVNKTRTHMKTLLTTLLFMLIFGFSSCATHKETWTNNNTYKLKPGKNFDRSINCLPRLKN